MATGYTPPGVTLTEIATPSTVSLADTQRLPIYIGKGLEYIVVRNEAVVRSSTGLLDSLAYTSAGITELLSVGSQMNLGDYIETTDYSLSGNEVLWTSTGTSPSVGATYYVSYKYTRPDSDYNTFKTFSDLDDFVEDIGYVNEDNDLGRAAYVGLKLLQLPLIGVIQTKSPYSVVDYQDSIDVSKELDYLISLYVLSTAYTVQTYLKAHVVERSLAQNKRERVAYMGAAIGTLPGTITTSDTIAGNAYALRTEEVIYLSPARCKFTYRNSETNLVVTSTENGSFLATAVGSYKDSIPDPSAPITRHDLSFMNIELYDEDRDTYFAETVMNILGGAGVLVVHPKTTRVLIRDDITTDTRDIRKSSLNVVIAKHYIVRYIRNDLDDTFIGNKILNREQYALSVKNRLVRIFSALRSEGMIENFDAGDLSAKVLADNPTVVYTRFAYFPIYTNKKILGEYYLKVA